MTDSEAIARLLDLEAIKTLKHRYIRYMTQSRWDELEGLMTEDVSTSYSDGKYAFSNRADLLRFLRDSHDAAQTHILGYWHVTMPEIEFSTRDEATGIWAMYHFHLQQQDLAKGVRQHPGGDDAGKIGRRGCVVDGVVDEVADQLLEQCRITV